MFGCTSDRNIPISVIPGAVNWRESAGGICGVYNPVTKEIAWRESYGGIFGVFNPKTGIIEWKESAGGICGVYLPE